MHLTIDRKQELKIKAKVMKTTLHITAMFDRPGFLESFIEKLADRRYDIGYSKAIVPADCEALETSSTETYTSGTIGIDNDEEIINMPFITRFLFTCVKRNDTAYRLAWGICLS
jgi:hypothetical protein